MNPNDIRRILLEFLDLVEGRAGSVTDAERLLSILLDQLAMATHGQPPAAPVGDLEAPRRSGAEVRVRVAARFPNYGLYRSAGVEPEGELLVGDAIDDITDIALDLSEVGWLWEHGGETDALWQFHFSFEQHWGAHLRGLQWYLHELRAQN